MVSTCVRAEHRSTVTGEADLEKIWSDYGEGWETARELSTQVWCKSPAATRPFVTLSTPVTVELTPPCNVPPCTTYKAEGAGQQGLRLEKSVTDDEEDFDMIDPATQVARPIASPPNVDDDYFPISNEEDLRTLWPQPRNGVRHSVFAPTSFGTRVPRYTS
jgi:hypothetical protein